MDNNDRRETPQYLSGGTYKLMDFLCGQRAKLIRSTLFFRIQTV
ncbi:hypothetical protein Dd1591_1830 [Dickeya chrysanthemi Ech1591]|uniref:Uncharacterized protein n=1 Tax=Dickeya chrysanthemi (strain Ech1591) TaxID=561229 RepID=C6CGB1_DICC1|nr:hypothetical protein Dd1591_1830 [Dickeya chrysanthemi Ech1591]